MKEEIQDIAAGLYAEAERLSAEESEQDARLGKVLGWRIMSFVH